MNAFLQERDFLLKTLESDAAAGLSNESAARNAHKYGGNRLTKENSESLLKRIWDAATEPMILMLIAAGIIALRKRLLLYVACMELRKPLQHHIDGDGIIQIPYGEEVIRNDIGGYRKVKQCAAYD